MGYGVRSLKRSQAMKLAICQEENCKVAAYRVRPDYPWCPNCGTNAREQVEKVTVRA